ncbi:MAG: peptidase C26 [Halobacteriovoraceae bacterium]|nr:peptidase C26 [Halobacteriovoraceae bacterium]
MLKLGVSACFMYPDIKRKFFGPKTLSYIENDMFAYLCKQNVMPILIPNIESDCQQMYLESMDGFVLQGGSDLSPLTYNESHLDREKWPGDKTRDEYEMNILRWAVINKRPVLGICRGAQLINAYFGGTLYQDIETQVQNSLQHRDPIKYDRICHEVRLTPGGKLFNAYHEENIWVNSVHHQGIKTLGKGMIAEAVSPKDDIIEAIRHEKLPILGVHWHPEFHHTLEDKVSDPQKLLEIFFSEIEATA